MTVFFYMFYIGGLYALWESFAEHRFSMAVSIFESKSKIITYLCLATLLPPLAIYYTAKGYYYLEDMKKALKELNDAVDELEVDDDK